MNQGPTNKLPFVELGQDLLDNGSEKVAVFLEKKTLLVRVLTVELVQ